MKHLHSAAHGCQEVRQAWETCLLLPYAKQGSTPPLCLLYCPKLFWVQEQSSEYHSSLFLGRIPRDQSIFPFAALPCWLLVTVSLRAGQGFHSQELSQLFSCSHILQTDEDFLQCLCYLNFFTKSFHISSACAKGLLHVLKIWNSSSRNGKICTLHFHSLIGAVWLWIVLTLTRAKSKYASCQ